MITLTGSAPEPAPPVDSGFARWRWPLVEAALLLLAPLLAQQLLRLRLMANPGLPDPAMHSVYLWDPGDLVRRYDPSVLSRALRHYIGPEAAYVRWGTRPGFLVPGRLAFLAFGTVPGFLVFRYVLALIAIVPAYLLGKRCYGPGVGAAGVCLVLASPVVVTAWGTDFPDSAAVSYLLGGMACLVMPGALGASRRRWRLCAAVLLTAGVWALATTGLLVAVAVVVVAVVTVIAHGWRAMLTDLLWLAIGAVATTLALAVGSWLVLGRFDYVVPTLQAVRFLDTHGQTRRWHSANWRWVLDDPYLLVLPATCLAWTVLAVRRRIPAAAVAIGAVATLQLLVAAAGQFGSTLQVLENHYLSSPMWAGSLLALTVVIAELTRPLAAHRVLRWTPAVLVLAVALVSEAAPHVPALELRWGCGLVALAVAAAATGWLPRRRPIATAVATVVILAALMALTVAPKRSSAALPHTVFDPPTGYADALGGSSRTLVEDYRLEQEVRRFVPNATYPREQLLDCVSGYGSFGRELIGMFHNSINDLHDHCPRVGPRGLERIRARNAAQLVDMTPDKHIDLLELMRHLASLHPLGVRVARLRSGSESVEVAVVSFPAALGPHHHDRRTAERPEARAGLLGRRGTSSPRADPPAVTISGRRHATRRRRPDHERETR